MPQSIISRLQELHPDYSFVAGNTFRWNPIDKIIEYDNNDFNEDGLQLLVHELGHAELGHSSFSSDIELIRKEVAAWDYVKQHASRYQIPYDEDLAERCLDSYRVWLDQRSCCPECGSTGYQPDEDVYQCINCYSQWSVSTDQQSRICRRKINTQVVFASQAHNSTS